MSGSGNVGFVAGLLHSSSSGCALVTRIGSKLWETWTAGCGKYVSASVENV